MNRPVDHRPNSRLVEVASEDDGVWRTREKIQEWFRRLNRRPRKQELDCLEERRLERMRIAGELHDTLLQDFIGACLIVDRMLKQMPEDSPARASLSHAAQLMHRSIEECRAVLQGLRSPIIASGSLEREFAELLNEAAGAGGVQTRILVVGKPTALKPDIQHQIYLIGREALVNALRHANATDIEIEVDYLRRHLRVMVRDNGCGIDEGSMRAGRTSHWGIVRMRERAKGIGADLRILSGREVGTEVEISVPSGIVKAV